MDQNFRGILGSSLSFVLDGAEADFGGVLFSSNPRGRNEEGWNSGRYGVYHDLESWSRYTSAAGFVEITHYYRPDGMPREQQPWLASVWRRWAP